MDHVVEGVVEQGLLEATVQLELTDVCVRMEAMEGSPTSQAI